MMNNLRQHSVVVFDTSDGDPLRCKAGIHFSAIAPRTQPAPLCTSATWNGRVASPRRRCALSPSAGFSIPRIYASMFLGWCDVEEGRAEEGRAAVRASLAEFTASGERSSTTNWRALLARAHLACGDVASAHEVLDAPFASDGAARRQSAGLRDAASTS